MEGDGKVSYKGEVMSASGAALKALQEKGYTFKSVKISAYWTI